MPIASFSQTARRAGPSRTGLLGIALLAALLALPAALDAQSYLMRMPTVEVAPGDDFALPIEGDWSEAIGGFQISIAIPPGSPLANHAIGTGNTIVGDMEPEFSQFNLSLEQGSIVGGVLFEWLPPFTGVVLPPIGFPIAIAEITGTVVTGAPQAPLVFAFQNGLGTPAVNNTFVVGFDSIPPEEIVDGVLDVRHPPVVIEEEFIRGDVNRDALIDVSDVIYHLNYTFGTGPTPGCLDAGDANDDGHSDISDGIFILLYLFTSGPAPWPPFPTEGTDFTPDSIGCAQGL
jgi:hypothetical protein